MRLKVPSVGLSPRYVRPRRSELDYNDPRSHYRVPGTVAAGVGKFLKRGRNRRRPVIRCSGQVAGHAGHDNGAQSLAGGGGGL